MARFAGFSSPAPDDDLSPAAPAPDAPPVPSPATVQSAFAPPAPVAPAPVAPAPVVTTGFRRNKKASDGAYINPPAWDPNDKYEGTVPSAPKLPAPAPVTPPAPGGDDVLSSLTKRMMAAQAAQNAPAPAPVPSVAPTAPLATFPAAASPAPAAPTATPGISMLPLDSADNEPDEPDPVPGVATAPATVKPAAAPQTPAVPTQPATSTAPAGMMSLDDDGGGDAKQARRNEAATNRYLRDQGAQMEVTPTGQTRQATDNQGTPLFKGTVLDHARQLDDGETYRVSRDESGNEHYFRLLDGAAGNDYKVDAQTGEQYVTGTGADGASKRVVLGTDPFSAIHAGLKERQASHQQERAAAQVEIDRAEQGVDGAPTLAALRKQAGQAQRAIAPAQTLMGKYQAYLQANPNAILDASQIAEYRSAEAVVNQHGPALDQVQGEIDQRQATIDAARQRHTAASALAGEAYQMASQLTGQRRVRQETLADVAAYADGADLPPARVQRYRKMGLLDENGDLTDAGANLLPRQSEPRPMQAAGTTGQAQPAPASEVRILRNSDAQPGQVRQGWLTDQKSVLSFDRRIGIPGSAENAAFVRAFRASGGDTRAALAAAGR